MGQIKTYYNKHIDSTKDKVAKLWHKTLEQCTPQIWKNSLKHCETFIREDQTKLMENCNTHNMSTIITNLTDDTDLDPDFQISDDDEDDHY